MRNTPKALRLQIALVGRTNVGKSSFLNWILGQDVAITSPIPGTTTDVVEKAAELLPIGPVLFLDTAGIDDATVLSQQRVERTRKALERADVLVLIVEPNVWTAHEDWVIAESRRLQVPTILVINKVDTIEPLPQFLKHMSTLTESVILCSCTRPGTRESTIAQFKGALLRVCPEEFLKPPPLLGDLLPKGALVVLVVPIDIQAPKGRLILPQVQAIRDVLDHGASACVVRDSEYAYLLRQLARLPDLVVCDSQVVRHVVEATPPSVPCTTFSILFSRFKGDLVEQARATASLERLRENDKVLIAEACSHHPLEEDIGRVKIPRWIHEKTGVRVEFTSCAGRDYPANLKEFALVVHCGACMLTRREMLRRLEAARAQGVPVTNYGLCIAHLQGVLDRVLAPFPEALDAYREVNKRDYAEVSHAIPSGS